MRKKNMGMLDRSIRIVLVIALAILIYTDTLVGLNAIIAMVAAGLLVLTSFISFCPLYWPFGIKTCKPETTKSE